MPTPVFTWPIAFQTKMNIKPRILPASFGDGYEQRVADGINNALETWDVSIHSLREVAGASPIEAFLRTQAGVTPFMWSTKFGRTALFICRGWSRTPTGPFSSIISGKFEEVPA